MTKFFLDSSAWIEYLDGSDSGAHVCYLLEKEHTYTSTLSLAEIGAHIHAKGMNPEKQLSFIERMSTIIPPSLETAKQAGPLRNTHRKKKPCFCTMDALIYLQAQETNAVLITKDTDFEGLSQVEAL